MHVLKLTARKQELFSRKRLLALLWLYHPAVSPVKLVYSSCLYLPFPPSENLTLPLRAAKGGVRWIPWLESMWGSDLKTTAKKKAVFPCMVSGIYWQDNLIYRLIIAEGALCWSTKCGNSRTRTNWWQEFLKAKKSSIPCWLQICCLSARLDIDARKLETNRCEICSNQYYQCDLQEQDFHCQEESRCWKVEWWKENIRDMRQDRWAGLSMILCVGRNHS